MLKKLEKERNGWNWLSNPHPKKYLCTYQNRLIQKQQLRSHTFEYSPSCIKIHHKTMVCNMKIFNAYLNNIIMFDTNMNKLQI